MDEAGHGQAELRLRVVDRVPAGDRAPAARAAVGAAAQDLGSTSPPSFSSGKATRFSATIGRPPIA